MSARHLEPSQPEPVEVWSRLDACHSTHYCAGCDEMIPPGAEHLEHYRQQGQTIEIVFECFVCARRNGRPEVAEPDVAEQPLEWDGIA